MKQEVPFQPIQLALQGGGAKMVYLLAMLEAIDSFKEIKVVRMAGTSAGALTGALYATDRSVKEIRNITEQLANTVITGFKAPNLPAIGWTVGLRKQAMWNEDIIRNILNPFFGEQITLNQLPIPIKLISSNLITCGEYVHSGADPIVSSILDSCGIPFLFRSKNAERVDGGLCSNLPVLQLRDDDPKFSNAPIVALSFPSMASSRSNKNRDYLLKLFDAAINNNVQNSRAFADLVFNLPMRPDQMIGMLDFKQARDLIKSREFSDLVDECKVEFKSKVIDEIARWKSQRDELPRLRNELELVRSGADAAQSVTISKLKEDIKNSHSTLNYVFEKHLLARKKVRKVLWEIFAHSLSPNGGLDQMLVQQTLLATNAPLHGIKAMIQGPFESTQWGLYKRPTEDESIPVSMKALSAKTDSQYTTVFLLPEHPIEIGEGEYLLQMKDDCDALAGFRTENSDEMFWAPSMIDGEITELILLLHYPPNVKVTMTKKPPTEWCARSESSLTEHNLGVYQGRAPAKWSTCGWIAKGVGELGFGVDLELEKWS